MSFFLHLQCKCTVNAHIYSKYMHLQCAFTICFFSGSGLSPSKVFLMEDNEKYSGYLSRQVVFHYSNLRDYGVFHWSFVKKDLTWQ